MDYIKGLPRSSGKTIILVIIDRLMKYVHFIPLEQPFTAKQVIEAFVQNIAKLHDMSRSIVSDRDRAFTSSFLNEFFAL